MVQMTGDLMSGSEETAVAVALTKMDGRLENIQLALTHQTELMGRNREDAIREIADCRTEIIEQDGRITALEKSEEQRKGAVRLAVGIAGLVGGGVGAGIIALTKFL